MRGFRACPGDKIGNGLCEDKPKGRQSDQNKRREPHTEPEGLTDPVILFRAVIKPADWLKALAESDQERCKHHHNPVDTGHGRLGRVNHRGTGDKQADGMIQACRGDAGDSLAGKGGKTALHDAFQIIGGGTEVFQPNFHVVTSLQTDRENREAHTLADCRCKRRAGDAHTGAEAGVETGKADGVSGTEDQNRIQEKIQHCPGSQSDHREECVSLKAKLIVHHDASHHDRRCEKDIAHVSDGVDHGLFRLGAQKTGETAAETKTERGEQKPEGDRAEEAGGGHLFGILQILTPESAGDVIAGAVAVVEADGLDNIHQRHDHPDGGDHAVTVQLTDKEGIRQIVKSRHKHADHGGDREFQDQRFDGLRRHAQEFGFGRLP